MIEVSWDLMTPEDAWGFVVNYTVSYSKGRILHKKQNIEKTVPGTENSLIIEDVDPNDDFFIVVWASTKAGKGEVSEPITTIGMLRNLPFGTRLLLGNHVHIYIYI